MPIVPICHVPTRPKRRLCDDKGDGAIDFEGVCNKSMRDKKVRIHTGQSASPSLERLPSSSPTTQPSQWWGTSMKYLGGAKIRNENVQVNAKQNER